MSRKYLLGVVLGLCTLGVQLGAKVNPSFDAQSLTGRYVSGADSMAISVNDLGEVEGFYTRAGAFGEVSGKLVDGIIVGSWMESSDVVVCSSKKRNYSSWGPLEAAVDSQGLLALRLGACDETSAEPANWVLQRTD